MNLVMFMDLSWDGTWYSRHQLTARLARAARVIVVRDPPDLRAALHHPWTLLRGGRVEAAEQGTLRYQPPGWLPQVYRLPGLAPRLQGLRARVLSRTLAREGFGPATNYVWHPRFQPAVAARPGRPLVYHCYDKYELYVGADLQEIRRCEAWFARHAQLCVAASVEFGEHLRTLGAENVLVLRHGVDSQRFHPGLPPAEPLAAIPGPRIGIVARFNEVLDVATVRYVAERRPDWSVVLVGGEHFTNPEKRRAFEDLCRLPNVHRAGEQPPTQIPRWLAGFDVGLMCYDLSTWAATSQPIKMYEYLACGLPVVSSDIRAARELGELVTCCGDPDGWVDAIERALADRSDDQVTRRLAFARANSWDRRTSELIAALERLPGR